MNLRYLECSNSNKILAFINYKKLCKRITALQLKPIMNYSLLNICIILFTSKFGGSVEIKIVDDIVEEQIKDFTELAYRQYIKERLKK